MVDSVHVARAIFVSYFVTIVCLFYLILNSLWRRAIAVRKIPRHVVTFSVLAVGSFYHTWFYMIQFLQWSFRDFQSRQGDQQNDSMLDRVTCWLMGTDLFEQAWRRVCQDPTNWWWSEQLCILTVGIWTTFLYAQGSHRRIPLVWAYMLLGQLVAISVACSLFFVAIVLHQDTPPKRASKPTSTTLIPPRVYVPVLLSHLTIFFSPHVAQSAWFLPNLLIMHTLIVVPLLDTSPSPRGISLQRFYLFLAALALLPRIQTYLFLPLTSDLPQGLIRTLYSHPAQSSIGFDVIWTTGSIAIYCAVMQGARLGLVGLVSPGLALYLDR